VLIALLLIAAHAYLSGRWATRPSKIQPRQSRIADPVIDRAEEESDPEPTGLMSSRNDAGMERTRTPVVSKSQKVTEGAPKIDLNRANAQELQRVPGIGPVTAQRIIDRRRIEPFQEVDDLRKVPGIGVKTLEKLRPFVRVNRSSEKDRMAGEKNLATPGF